MKKYLNVLVSLLLVVLQVTLFSRLKIFGLNVNFALICVIVVASLTDSKISIINAVVTGILYDFYACYNVGWNLTMFTVIALLMILIVKFMYKGSIVTAVTFTAIFTIITELILYWFGYLSNGNSYNSLIIVKIILPQAIINSIISLVVFYLYKKFNNENRKYRY